LPEEDPMKKLQRRLQLNRETLLRLARLAPDEAEKVAGGLCTKQFTTCGATSCERCTTLIACC
jgi:hypothetical protein